MHKLSLGLLCLFCLASTRLQAGAFIANFLVIDSTPQAVEAFLDGVDRTGISGIFDPATPRFYLICDQVADTQDLGFADYFGGQLSASLACPVLFTLVHDSDILVMVLYEDGAQTFFYDSWPGYWDGGEPIPAISNLPALVRAFGVSGGEVAAILKRPYDEYPFAEDRLGAIQHVLGIPDYIFMSQAYALELGEDLASYGFQVLRW